MEKFPMPAIPTHMIAPPTYVPGYDNHGGTFFLKLIAHYCQHGNQAHSWGYTMFRTAFGGTSDAQFDFALARLKEYLRYGIETEFDSETTPGSDLDRVKHELLDRLHCDVIEETSLSDASMEAIAAKFSR